MHLIFKPTNFLSHLGPNIPIAVKCPATTYVVKTPHLLNSIIVCFVILALLFFLVQILFFYLS